MFQINLFDSADKIGQMDVPSAVNLADATGDTEDKSKKSVEGRSSTALCFPLESLLLALNTTRVDYFSLNAEGFELDVLGTIPFDRLDIDVISFQFSHAREPATAYDELMSRHGFARYTQVNNVDFVFAKTDLLRRQSLASAAASDDDAAAAAAIVRQQDELKRNRVEQRHDKQDDNAALGELDQQKGVPADGAEDEHKLDEDNAAADHIDDQEMNINQDGEPLEMARNKFIIYENER